MKIKYLKIRNIASIESGDIDFESGLNDKESGLPASVFLITGDTGSGKSVILDCISMALYGTTPRVKSVSDARNNSYKNNDGEEISINNIRQYTRIGISWKDDCYTELSFSGNDGLYYVSRFSLGRTSRRNYRNPEWKLTIADTTTIEKKDDIKERIQEAVGLTFEQFSRMAMLAQGQFATFLTGKKEERERVLEQLTATDIFSRYGDAISNIFKKSKQEKEICAKLFEEYGKKILSEEQRQQLISEQSEKAMMSSTCQRDADRLRKRIEHTEGVMKAEKEIVGLKSEEAALKAIEDTVEFRKTAGLLNLWDATTSQRELLSEKIKATEKISSDKEKLKKKKSEFILLSEDLADRKEEAKAQTERLKEERLWIESQEPRKQLYSDSAGIIEKIHRFIATGKEIRKKEKESKDTTESIQGLQEKVSSQEKEVETRGQKCMECQESITRKSAERDSLNPSGLRKENDRLLKLLLSFNELSTKLDAFETERKETEKAEKETSELTAVTMRLKEDAEQTTAKCAQTEKEKNEAESRYVTMHLSVEKNFEGIRHRLAEEHASNCPLCGQSIRNHIHEWNSDGYFAEILSPLEEEKKKLAEAYTLAKKEADEASQKMNTSLGNLKAKEDDLKKRKSKLSKIEKEVKEMIVSLQMDYREDLKVAVAAEISGLNSEIEIISEKLNRADKLQKEIDALIKVKESLDQEYKEAEKDLHGSHETLVQKKATLGSTETRIKELQTESANLREELNHLLKDYNNNWEKDPGCTSANLKKDSETYAKRTSRYSKDEPEYRAECRILEALSETEKNLCSLLDAIEESESREDSGIVGTLKTDALQERWNALNIEVATATGRISDNEKRIKELNDDLNEYYLATGKTETTLKELLGIAKEINTMRSKQEKHNSDLNRNATLMAENQKKKNDNLKALDIEYESQMEDIEDLRKELEELDKRNSELTQRLGAIKQKLESDEETRKESERQRTDLERKTLRFEKWEKMNRYFGGTRFRTLVQSHILRPLLNNANIYLRQITDHYTLTCSDENEQLSILVLDRYHNNEPRSVTVLSGGERFMISLALSLALSAMNRPDLNVDILFIDEGFGTLDAKSLETVMSTLRRLPEINGQTGRRVGVISHREELTEQIPTQIRLLRSGEGRSRIGIFNT